MNRGGDKVVLAHLGHLAASGHEVVIRSNMVDTIFPMHPAICLEKPRFGSKLGTLVSALIERQRADMVVATIVPTAVLLAVRNRGRVLYFAQDDNETAYRTLWLRLAIRCLYSLAFSVATLPSVTVSRALSETFKKRFGAECRVVCNGVDTGVFFPSPSAELLAAKEGRKAILLLSRNDPRKGYETARQAIANLLESAGCPIEVWTVGDPTRPEDFPCSHRHFGTVDEDMMRTIMSSADVFLYPSRSEGFGLMVLEAFACKCPVVTTEAVTYVTHGENALVSAIGDYKSIAAQLRLILDDREFAASLSERAFGYALAHTMTGASRDFEQAVLDAVHRLNSSNG